METIVVRVIASNGNAVQNERVWVHIYDLRASGSKDQCVDSDGKAEFTLDIESGAEISLSVRGTQFVSRAPARARYQIQL